MDFSNAYLLYRGQLSTDEFDNIGRRQLENLRSALEVANQASILDARWAKLASNLQQVVTATDTLYNTTDLFPQWGDRIQPKIDAAKAQCSAAALLAR